MLPALVLASAALILAAGGQTARLALRYDRGAILDGEAWRLVTGHLVHLGWAHALLNVAGLVLVWILVGTSLAGVGWLIVSIGSVIAMGAGFMLLEPGLGWYVGLSGLLHGLFVAGALAMTLDGQRDGLVMLVLAMLKLAWEQFAGPLPLTADAAGGPVIVDAHLYGALGALVGAGLALTLSRGTGRKPP